MDFPGPDCGDPSTGSGQGLGHPRSLEELAAGEVLDEAAIGGQEFVVGQVFEGRPDHLGEDAVLEVAGEVAHSVKLQVHRAAMTVVVADVSDAGADLGLDAEFFMELAGEGLLGRLAGFDFASGEFPLERHGLVGAALADEHLAVADNERRRDKPERGPGRPWAGKLLGTFHMPSVQGCQDSQNVGVWDRSGGDGWRS